MSALGPRRTAWIVALSMMVVTPCSSVAQPQQSVPSLPDQQVPAKKAAYRIAGRVLSASDGHPLSGVTVSILQEGEGNLQESVISGSEGAFAFEDLPAGKFALFGQRRGFVNAAYNQHDPYSTAFVTGAGIDTGSLVLRLQPTASLTGRVLNEFGEPVQAAQVTLFREGYETGRREIKTKAAGQTDSFGEFSFSDLDAGKYLIAVRATPWYAVATGAPNPESPFVTGVDAALDVAYPLTFFGDATKQEAAVPILLKAGTDFRADVHVAAVRAVRITLRGRPGDTPEAASMLEARVFSDLEQFPMAYQQTPDGALEITGLAPGRYEFETRQENAPASHRNSVDLTQGPVEIDPGRSPQEASIQLTVMQETGNKLPAQSLVMLVGTTPADGQRQFVSEQGEADFPNVPPGDYRFTVFSENRPWQTISIEEAGKPINQTHRQLAAGESATLKLVVAPTSKSVEGFAVRDGKPLAGAMIVLVPVDGIENVDLFRRDQSDLDGSFTLLNVAAGRYIVVALANGWELEWGKPEVLAPLLPKGIAIEVSSRERGVVNLPRPVAVQ